MPSCTPTGPSSKSPGGLPSSAGRMRQLGHPDWPLGPFGEAFDLELDYYLEHDFDSGCFVDLDYFDFDFRCRIRGRLHDPHGSHDCHDHRVILHGPHLEKGQQLEDCLP